MRCVSTAFAGAQWPVLWEHTAAVSSVFCFSSMLFSWALDCSHVARSCAQKVLRCGRVAPHS
eukprot:4056200-Alexandrium_andersonii.AAC.1